MNRDVCGICWCPYDDNGACGCQTLDDALRITRAMSQAYENGYKAGAAAEREACAELVEGMDVQHPKYIAAAIRARSKT